MSISANGSVTSNMFSSNLLADDDTWSSSSNDSNSGAGSYLSQSVGSGYNLYEDYFGLSNLINTVKISDDNPLMVSSNNLAYVQRGARRISWDSDGSDPSMGQSTMLSSSAPATSYENFGANRNEIFIDHQNGGNAKQLPPPSMRLSKSLRDQIISGEYQRNLIMDRAVEDSTPTDPASIPPPSPTRKAPLLPSSPPRATVAEMRICVFCRNNGEQENVFTSHVLKDAMGKTVCPILRAYTCPICKACGDSSHTIKYCPMNQKMGNGLMVPSRNVMGSHGRGYQQRPSLRPPFASMTGPRQGRMIGQPQHGR